MKTMKLGYLFLIPIFLYSCTNLDRQSNNKSSTKNKQITFKLNPELAKIYRYSVVTETEMEQEVNEEKMKNSNILETGIDYSFKKDFNANYVTTATFTKFKLAIKAGEEEKELDASRASAAIDPTENIFGAFKDAQIRFVLDSLGNVKSVSGTKAISDKMYQLANGNAEALQMVNGSIKQYVGDTFFKQVAEQNFKIFTNKQIRTGDTVMVTTPINVGLNFTITTIYRLKSVEKGIANIEGSAEFELKDQEIMVEGTEVNANLSGAQSGDLRINIATGLIQESRTRLQLKGEIKVKGNEVPIKLVMNNRIFLQ